MAPCPAMQGSLGINDGELCGVECMEVKLKWVKENAKVEKEDSITELSSGLEGLCVLIWGKLR